ncbi:hypothetical protein AC578_8545 [Pseudocercospora eumusae]|uniref:Uncharacterized protein n=1 Tax=Pseudocercospora eumusae TaxID=321146 RepID=A0A139HW73_9PEZI|nr:hypothetical protein AC578_8545 [Pseudocercospora eumusae]
MQHYKAPACLPEGRMDEKDKTRSLRADTPQSTINSAWLSRGRMDEKDNTRSLRADTPQASINPEHSGPRQTTSAPPRSHGPPQPVPHQRVPIRTIELPHNIDYGTKELLTFFPDCIYVKEILIRWIRNGIGPEIVAKCLLATRDKLTHEAFVWTRNLIRNHMAEAMKVTHIPLKAPNVPVVDDRMTSNHWAGGQTLPLSAARIKLELLGRKIPREGWPQGRDRGPLTMCLEKVQDIPFTGLDTSAIPELIRFFEDRGEAFRPPIPEAGLNWDAEFFVNFDCPDPIVPSS